jgi:hypothetical protein
MYIQSTAERRGETVDNIFDSHITSPQLVTSGRTYENTPRMWCIFICEGRENRTLHVQYPFRIVLFGIRLQNYR